MRRWLLLVTGALLATRGTAQVTPPATPSPPPPTTTVITSADTTLKRCLGQRITKISIEPMGPEFGGRSASSRLITGLVRKFHADSRASVIREFVQFREGDLCTEIKRRETERVLRAQWFLQDARVLVYPDGDGVQLIVATVDEVAMILGANVSGTNLRGLTIGNSNLMGRGVLFEVGWRSNGALRDGRTMRMRTAVTFGRPIQSSVAWNRYGLGSRADAEVRYPFYTDLQRFGFRALVGRDDDYVRFLRDSGGLPYQRVKRSFASVGGVARIGRPGALLLAGASVSYDGEDVGGAVLVTDSGAVSFAEALPVLPAPPQKITRMNLLFGGRALRFLPVQGFDALTGVQDLRIGVQFGGQFGRPVKLRGITTSDFFVSGDAYAGWGTDKVFVGSEWIFSGRKSHSSGWDGRLVTGRTAAYVKPSLKSTTIGSVEYTGGNDVRVPFQVPLGASRVGVRGLRESYEGGQSRVILRGEQRHVFGRPWGFGDVGGAAFFETGKLWAGRAPYGVETPFRSSLGTSVLFSVPPRSRVVYRFDLVYALNPDQRSGNWEVRLTSGNFTRIFWQDPDETRRARERSLITNLFSF
ncbi:MAG: hypothetical protein IT355_10810 [Gemmatimonadaceae bacterium]|nr:hypothetical protein [Gemmatimonadaceae bacterium]